jgi:hypothetical protein
VKKPKKSSKKTLPKVTDEGKPVVSYEDAQKTAEFYGLGPKGTDPQSLTSFKDHLIHLFGLDDDECLSTRTLVGLANGLFFKGHYRKETIVKFAEAFVGRMSSDHVSDDSDPLLNALYLAAGEFLGLMHEVERERYFTDRESRLGGSKAA